MNDAVLHLFGNIEKMEASYTPKGQFILKGSIAVNFGKGDKKTTNWYNFVAWEKRGELMNDLCQVGSFVFVEGNLVLREWTDKEGSKHVSPDLTVSDFRILGKGKSKDTSEESAEAYPEYLQE